MKIGLKTPLLALLTCFAAVAPAALESPDDGDTKKVVRFPESLLVDGTRVPAHASVSGDPSDGEAARRRARLAASPYAHIRGESSLLDGAIIVAYDAEVPAATVERVVSGLAAFSATLERDGWSRPYSAKDPLRLVLTGGSSELPAVAGWARGDGGRLVDVIVAVPSGRRSGPSGSTEATLFAALRQVALLSARQSAPDESAWSVEALAETLARAGLGWTAEPVAASDPLLAEMGRLDEPPAAAAFLGTALARLPGRGAELRRLWDEAGASRGDDAEAFLRQVAARVDSRGLPSLLADLLAARLQAAGRGSERGDRADRSLDASDLGAAAPVSFGWRRIALRTAEERGGLEISLPDHGAVGAGRVVLFYRGRRGEFDVAALEPGGTRLVPLSGTAELDLLLVDGSEAPDFYVRLRRAPDYPAALTGSGVEWREGAARISWRTSSHRDLLAWVVTRFEDSPEGQLLELGREIVPTASASENGFDYEVTDREATADGAVSRRLRYRVFALTRDGLLSEAFEAALSPAP